MTIRLKSWAESWDAVARGDKTAEIRSTDDRTFSVGDIIELERWDPESNTRATLVGVPSVIAARITHIDHLAGDVNLFGVRLNKPDKPGTLVRVAVLSIYVMGPVFE